MNEIESKPPMQFPIIDEIIAKYSPLIPIEIDPEQVKKTYIGFFNASKIIYQSNIANMQPADIIKHIKILEIFANFFTTRKEAAEFAYIEFLKKADKETKKAIAEEDKKYKPQFKEREASEKIKMTDAERKISGLVKLGMKRSNAEKLIFGKPCERCGMRICQCNSQEPKVPTE